MVIFVVEKHTTTLESVRCHPKQMLDAIDSMFGKASVAHIVLLPSTAS
jgi:hypothetical protein